ncbi:MAG: nuclear transport factor 2 family protein [Lachnospiraceae bacterium]|jgi:hypothetical protein|nr:nuclear transport factor 2 family protein [Lachnospiraceae bacterium]
MEQRYTDKELMARVWDVENIKTLIHKRVYYIADDRREDELSDLWVSAPENMATASFGRNWGFYVGMDAIRGYYVDAHAKRLAQQMERTGAAEPNVGNLYAHPASTGLVRLAGDGLTAKGLWYCIAQETTALGDGTADARWMLERIAADFVKESDGWKIWHMVIAADLNCEAGENYSKQPVYVDWDSDPVKAEFGTPTVAALTHDPTFNWWDGYPFIPEPYETFHDSISYGPEGFVPNPLKGLSAGEGRGYMAGRHAR